MSVHLGSSTERFNLSHFIVFGAFSLMAFRLFRITFHYAVNLLVWDQWDLYNGILFEKHSLWQIFRWQHGPHRQGVGGILSKLLGPMIQWNTRYEAFAIAAVIIVAAALALYLKQRLYGSIQLADLVIPSFFLTPVQYETLIGTTNPAHGAMPLLLMVLYCLSWTLAKNTRKYICVLVTNFLLTYTGFGLFIGFLTPALIAVDYLHNARQCGQKERAVSSLALLLSVASVVSFFLGYKLQPAADCFSLHVENPLLYGLFMDLMFANYVGMKGGKLLPPLIGGAILVVFVICLDKSLKKLWSTSSQLWTRNAVISVLLSYCLVFSINTAFGRLCMGMPFATLSRYTPYLTAGFFGLYLSALSNEGSTLRKLSIVGVLVLALLTAGRVNKYDAESMQGVGEAKRAWRECYLAQHSIEHCDAVTGFPIHPHPDATHLQEKLDFLEERHLNLYASQK